MSSIYVIILIGSNCWRVDNVSLSPENRITVCLNKWLLHISSIIMKTIIIATHSYAHGNILFYDSYRFFKVTENELCQCFIMLKSRSALYAVG